MKNLITIIALLISFSSYAVNDTTQVIEPVRVEVSKEKKATRIATLIMVIVLVYLVVAVPRK